MAAEKFAARHFVRLGLRRSEEFGGTSSECLSLSLQPASPIVKKKTKKKTETVSKCFFSDLFRPSLFSFNETERFLAHTCVLFCSEFASSACRTCPDGFGWDSGAGCPWPRCELVSL